METLLCPRTREPMLKVTIDGVTVDISEACGGVWFDNFELRKFDELHESAGDKLLEILQPFHRTDIDRTARLKCPKCDGIVLMRQFYSPKRQIEIDTCPACGGVWLDPGELATLRSLFETEQEKEEYVEAFTNELFAAEIAHAQARTEQDLQTIRQVSHALRFLCPSKYLPKALRSFTKSLS